MPAFEGLRAIRTQALSNSSLSINDVIAVVKRVDPDAHAFDLDAAVVLHGIVSVDVSCEGIKFYQCCIGDLLLHTQPVWAKMMTLGRGRFIKKLDRDEQSVFREAGLLVDPPTDEIIIWWDRIKGHVRLETDQEKLERARQAEKLSLIKEKERLRSIGVNEDPRWISIEDETAGYDVLSYEKNEYGLINRLIEVKSTIASPLRFYITRNEWDQALLYGEAYCFHIWDMQKSPPALYERTVSDVAPHIPHDNEKGKWKNAEIPVNT